MLGVYSSLPFFVYLEAPHWLCRPNWHGKWHTLYRGKLAKCIFKEISFFIEDGLFNEVLFYSMAYNKWSSFWGQHQQAGRASVPSPSVGEPQNSHCFDWLFLGSHCSLEAAIVEDFPSVLLGNKYAAKHLLSFGSCKRSWRSGVQIYTNFTELKTLLMVAEKMNLYSNGGMLILQKWQVL